MPINAKKMAALKDEYGDKKGESVYYAMENKAKSKGGKNKAALMHKVIKMASSKKKTY